MASILNAAWDVYGVQLSYYLLALIVLFPILVVFILIFFFTWPEIMGRLKTRFNLGGNWVYWLRFNQAGGVRLVEIDYLVLKAKFDVTKTKDKAEGVALGKNVHYYRGKPLFITIEGDITGQDFAKLVDRKLIELGIQDLEASPNDRGEYPFLSLIDNPKRFKKVFEEINVLQLFPPNMKGRRLKEVLREAFQLGQLSQSHGGADWWTGATPFWIGIITLLLLALVVYITIDSNGMLKDMFEVWEAAGRQAGQLIAAAPAPTPPPTPGPVPGAPGGG